MKILHIIHSINPKIGGPLFALKNIIEVEKFLGYNSEVLSISYEPNQDGNYKFAGVNAFIFPSSFPKRFSASKYAVNWLKRHYLEYDMFIIHGVWTGLYLSTMNFLQKKNSKYIIRPAGSLGVYDISIRGKKSLKTLLGKIYLRHRLESSKFIYVTSDKEEKDLILYESNPKIKMLPIPFDSSLRKSENQEIDIDRQQPMADLKILYLSRIERNKGIFELLNAMLKLIQKSEKLTLTIAGVGKGKIENEISAFIKENNLASNVRLIGFVGEKNKNEAFRNADVFILPSMSENFGNAVLESLSYNVPAIITTKVPLSEIVAKHNAGWICEPNIDSIYNSLLSIIQNKHQINEKAKNCRKVLDEFSIEKLAPIYKKAYEEND